ncbi:GGDEF domain-containing protein [Streptomyces echinoruber]|uniref:GGDEF domain-containing protein n=1 Tax=Streptomyces echinoruber TaxID=68898 RepID=A0A918RXY9_9ACTN|nr:GGDEF domain-containing protein [Streptomyces echinoruber]GHA13068.1 GGDEF domain-containing protein [Streptomyces echinoruber]
MNDVVTALAAAVPLASGWVWHGVVLRRRLAAARRDPLSGLPTRAVFEHRAARALARGPHAVLLLDLDGFKQLNDTFGHAAGDEAIRTVAARLGDALSDRRGGVAARLGGDEFAAVVPLPDAAVLPWLLGGLHGEVTAPFAYRGMTLAVGASIGACVTAELPAPSLPLALRRADEAMYAAKRAGGGWRIAGGPAPTCTTTAGRRTGRPGTHTPHRREAA